MGYDYPWLSLVNIQGKIQVQCEHNHLQTIDAKKSSNSCSQLLMVIINIEHPQQVQLHEGLYADSMSIRVNK